MNGVCLQTITPATLQPPFPGLKEGAERVWFPPLCLILSTIKTCIHKGEGVNDVLVVIWFDSITDHCSGLSKTSGVPVHRS